MSGMRSSANQPARMAMAVLVSLCMAAAPASAQWGATGIGVVEYDTNETLLALAGLSFSPAGLGWVPVVGIQTQFLTYDRGTSTARIWSVRPSAGLKNNFIGGSAQARVGYAFRTDDDVPIGTIVPDTDDGVVVTGQVDYWGTGGPLGAQAIASYNFGGESLWTRGRLTTRVAQRAQGGQVRLGGEVAYMTSTNFNALQPGGVLEWHNGRGLVLGLGVGVKLIDDTPDATYFRGEVVLPVGR